MILFFGVFVCFVLLCVLLCVGCVGLCCCGLFDCVWCGVVLLCLLWWVALLRCVCYVLC